MIKIALNAGHYLGTAGKRCLKSLDANETREWVLNNRICDKVEQSLKEYTGYSLLRIDDTTGNTDITVADRAKKANNFGADIYISVHHNAGINGGTGGGIVAYTYTKVDQTTKDWQKQLYDKLIEKTSLKGNRAQPLASADLGECRLTKMPAVLLECGFMDSATDVPVILSEDFANKCAEAITETIVQKGGLTKIPTTQTNGENKQEVLYRVQVGAYKVKANAEKMKKKLQDLGFDAIIKAE